MMRLLVEAGADPDSKGSYDGEECSVLVIATRLGRLDLVRLLVEAGADPEAQGSYGGEEYSVLGMATRLGRLDIVRLLVEAGAVAWRIAHKGHVALYIACEEGWMELVEYLLEVGGKLNDKDGEECLAAAAGRMRLSVVEFLMQKDVTQSGEALKAAMALPPAVQRQAEFLRLVDMLLEGRPMVFPEVVFEAIQADNHIGLVRILSSGKCNLTICKTERWGFNGDCLSYARLRRKTDFVRLLESYGF